MSPGAKAIEAERFYIRQENGGAGVPIERYHLRWSLDIMNRAGESPAPPIDVEVWSVSLTIFKRK